MARDTARNGTSSFWAERKALIILGAGLAAATAGFIGGLGREGEIATNFGILAGVGVALVGAAVVMMLVYRGAKAIGDDPGGSVKRERLQTQRSRQLTIFPILTALFLVQAIPAVGNIIERTADTGDYLQMLLPVLYSWVATAIAMGWDGQSRKERKFLEDELTRVLRARAMAWAFVALMAGVTASLGIGLWRPEVGIVSLPLVLSAAGATAAIRFAWLDREAGRDDG